MSGAKVGSAYAVARVDGVGANARCVWLACCLAGAAGRAGPRTALVKVGATVSLRRSWGWLGFRSAAQRPQLRPLSGKIVAQHQRKKPRLRAQTTRARSVLARRISGSPRRAAHAPRGAPRARARKPPKSVSVLRRACAALAAARARDAAASTAQHILPPWAPPPAENARARVPTPVRAAGETFRRAAARAAARPPSQRAARGGRSTRCAGGRRGSNTHKHPPRPSNHSHRFRPNAGR